MDRGNWQLELALAPTLQALGGEARDDLALIASMGFRSVQISAMQPGLRPRELDGSARRGLRTALRRLDLALSGVDLWIPPEHFTQSEYVDRAVAAVRGAIELAADLDRVPVSLSFPAAQTSRNQTNRDAAPRESSSISWIDDAIAGIVAHAQRFGVELVDHAVPITQRERVGVGIDPAAWLALGEDPARIVAKLGGDSAAQTMLVSARLVDLLHNGMRGPVGHGPDHLLDTLAYRVALSVAGYRRPVVVDARQWADVRGGLREAQWAWDAAGARVTQ